MLKRQCLDRRIDDRDELERAVTLRPSATLIVKNITLIVKDIEVAGGNIMCSLQSRALRLLTVTPLTRAGP